MNEGFLPRQSLRKSWGAVWNTVFVAATLVGILSLATLLYTIVDEAFGLVALEYTTRPEELALVEGKTLDQHTPLELAGVIRQALIDYVGTLTPGIVSNYESIQGKPLEEWAAADLMKVISTDILEIEVQETFGLTESLLQRGRIEAQVAEEYPDAVLQFRSWLSGSFLTGNQSSLVLDAGIRSAVLGTLWTIAIAILFAFPIGVGAAIYLQEYAGDTKINRFIQTNIYNLAGVPSIIYGMLGLALFVRALEPLTSGEIFGGVDPVTANGRTILSAGLTLGILILPVIIINAQEAFKAIPNSLRYSAYGVGATRWQMIWHHLIPASFDRVLTGTVFAVSRAIGETAPLVVIGASTFLTLDPTGPFSKFTVLPMQIYTWTARPEEGFKNAAGAAILVLLVLLIALNLSAILYRNHLRKSKEASS